MKSNVLITREGYFFGLSVQKEGRKEGRKGKRKENEEKTKEYSRCILSARKNAEICKG